MSLSIGIGLSASGQPSLPTQSVASLVVTGLEAGSAALGQHGSIAAQLTDGASIVSYLWGSTAGGSQFGTAPNPSDFTTSAGGQLHLQASTAAATYTAIVPIEEAASPPASAPVLTFLVYDDEADIWSFQSDTPSQGAYIWARQLLAQPVAGPDGAGGWSAGVEEQGNLSVAAYGEDVSVPTTGTSGETYRLCLYQRVAGEDSNVITVDYIEGAPVAMPPVLQTTTEVIAGASNDATSYAGTLSAQAGADRALIIFVNALASNNDPLTLGVTVGGVEAVSIGVNPAPFILTMPAAFLMLESDIPSGPQPLVVTASANLRACSVTVMEFEGVNQTSAVGPAVFGETGGTALTSTVVTQSDQSLVFAGLVGRVINSTNAPVLSADLGTVAYAGQTGTAGNSDCFFVGSVLTPGAAGPHAITLSQDGNTTQLRTVAFEILGV